MVPTVVRILPAGNLITDPVEGPTSGRQLIEIYGDGFRLPNTDPVAQTAGSPFIVAPKPRSVSVKFDGVEAVDVEVAKTNLLRVITPPTPITIDKANNHGAGAVDVVIQNLDDNEDPIGGESITLVDGYDYRRIKLDATVQADLVRLVRRFMRMVKAEILPEVVLTVNTDWDRDTLTQYVDIAKLPAIVLIGPGTPENRFYSQNSKPESFRNGRVETSRKPHTVDLLFDMVGISDDPIEALNILSVAIEFVNRNPFIFLDRDPADLSKGKVKYEFDFQPAGGFSMGNKSNKSNVHSFNGSVVIRGFDIEGFQGFKGEHLQALSEQLDEGVILDVGPK